MHANNNRSCGDNEARHRLKEDIDSGHNWYLALLKAIGLWTSPVEIVDGRTRRYLIDGEAFDFLLLSERLIRDVEEIIPEEERNGLIFRSRPPVILPASRFKELIGAIKYRHYLNYFYGVVVEQTLVQVITEKLRKEKTIFDGPADSLILNEVYRYLYSVTVDELLQQFRRDKREPYTRSVYFEELKEFTYWLFKYKLERSDKAKIASDTKKALDWLKRNGYKLPPLGES